jgi:diaminopimelate decarboxylase
MLNESIAYRGGELCCDQVSLNTIADQVGTPVYVYSLGRVRANLARVRQAFAPLNAHIHYSAKANGNLAILRAVVEAGAGVDAVSAGEIQRAIAAGCPPDQIVFAGVGKTPAELRYAIAQGVGWINVENEAELDLIDRLAGELGVGSVRIALRLNPDISANTHPHIATGHGGAKFGLLAETIARILAERERYSRIRIEGLHVHIGSQLGDPAGTVMAVEKALSLAAPCDTVRTINIGGGLPVAYRPEQTLADYAAFAARLAPLLDDYDVILEPGRSIVADAGVLLAEVLYLKQQGGQNFLIVDASMAELIRPALYGAHHEVMPLYQADQREKVRCQIVGPVCETTDVLGRDIHLPPMNSGQRIAFLTVGAYGMVMASNYNARLRPAEVVVGLNGESWWTARPRDEMDTVLQSEIQALRRGQGL